MPVVTDAVDLERDRGIADGGCQLASRVASENNGALIEQIVDGSDLWHDANPGEERQPSEVVLLEERNTLRSCQFLQSITGNVNHSARHIRCGLGRVAGFGPVATFVERVEALRQPALPRARQRMRALCRHRSERNQWCRSECSLHDASPVPHSIEELIL